MTFVFHPELFAFRGQAIEQLASHGYEWLSHYSSVDLLHEEFGLEVNGVSREEDAREILRVLRRTFPTWRHSRVSYREYGREVGWRVIVHRDLERDAGRDWVSN